jgi:hypothetical protein
MAKKAAHVRGDGLRVMKLVKRPKAFQSAPTVDLREAKD